MEIKRTESYICGECRKKYNSKEDALNCEKSDKAERQRDNLAEFEIKEEHLKLLKEMNVGWDDCEFGAPNIDPKRPYGNSDGVNDVARVIGFKKTKDTVEFDKEEAEEYDYLKDYLEDAEWNEKSYDYLLNLHKDMQIVLQIVLSTLSFKKGIYKKKDKYSSEWEMIS
jgi:hypothetical protein